MAVEQIYYTHCTYGTSAIDRRRGELENRARGYSARAGSVPQSQLRTWKEKIARVISYRLPDGYSKDEIRALEPRDAPRQLVFLPKFDESNGTGNRSQLLAQVSHRPEDTSHRAGSYFAHVLLNVSERGGSSRSWTARECLQFWGAPLWIEADSNEIGYELTSFGSTDELRGGGWEPLVSDEVLLRFLVDDTSNAPAGGDSYSLIVPERWRVRPAAQRRCLVDALLRAYFTTMLSSSQSAALLIVAEPEFAALLFFAVARLLPDGPLTEDMDFSTFEPDPQRLRTRLAATVSRNSQEEGGARQAYSADKIAINTFHAGASGLANNDSELAYPSLVLEKLADEKCWSGADALLADFSTLIECDAHQGKPRSARLKSCVAQLDELVRATLLAPRLLTDSAPAENWEHWTSGKRYLEKQLRQQLARIAGNPPQWKRLTGDVERLMFVLNLICTDREPSDEVDRLIERMWREGVLHGVDEPPASTACDPEEAAAFEAALAPAKPGPLLADGAQRDEDARVVRALALPDIAPRLQKKLIGLYLHERRRLPGGSEFLWENPKHAALMGDLLAEQNEGVVESLFEQLDRKHHRAFGLLLADAYGRKPPSPGKSVTELRPKFVARLETSLVYDLLRNDAARFMKGYPKEDAALGVHLGAILTGLPEHAEEFTERLRVLKEHVGFLSISGQERVASWLDLAKRFHELRELQREHSSSFLNSRFGRRKLHQELYERMVPVIGNYRDGIGDENLGAARLSAQDLARRLWSIGESVMAAPLDLPAEFQKELVKYFNAQPSKLLRRRHTDAHAHSRRGLYAAAVFVSLSALAIALGFAYQMLAWTAPERLAISDRATPGDAASQSEETVGSEVAATQPNESTAPAEKNEVDADPTGSQPTSQQIEFADSPVADDRTQTEASPISADATPQSNTEASAETSGAGHTSPPVTVRPSRGRNFRKVPVSDPAIRNIAEVVEGFPVLPTLPSSGSPVKESEVLLALDSQENYTGLRVHCVQSMKDGNKRGGLEISRSVDGHVVRIQIKDRELCEFELSPESLLFRWIGAPTENIAKMLGTAVVELQRKGGESRFLSLWPVQPCPSMPFDLASGLEARLPTNELPETDTDFFDKLCLVGGRLCVDRHPKEYVAEIKSRTEEDGQEFDVGFMSIEGLSTTRYVGVVQKGRHVRLEFLARDETSGATRKPQEDLEKLDSMLEKLKESMKGYPQRPESDQNANVCYNQLRKEMGLKGQIDFTKDPNAAIKKVEEFEEKVASRIQELRAKRSTPRANTEEIKVLKERKKEGRFFVARKLKVGDKVVIIPLLILPEA